MRQTIFIVLIVLALSAAPSDALADVSLPDLGPDELVQANGFDITVTGYSVPSLADWNNNNLNDLIVGEGGGSGSGKVRV